MKDHYSLVSTEETYSALKLDPLKVLDVLFRKIYSTNK